MNRMSRPLHLRRVEDIYPRETASKTRILCVGDLLRDCGCPPSFTYSANVETISWPLLAEKVSCGLRSGRIYSATMSINFDCVDIAQLLYRGGFSGEYRVFAPDMPNPDLIRREVLSMCPGLDFDIETGFPVGLIRTC